MFHQLRRHPVPVVSHFDHCLVLTYAGLADVLREQLPPGLEIDRFGESGELGFLAVAIVQTRRLRPAGLPALLGRDFFLVGYRIFCRFHGHGGRSLRGLRILRSDTDRRTMVCFGNLLTHYNYRRAKVRWSETSTQLNVEVITPRSDADLTVHAFPSPEPAQLPVGSCFTSVKEARRFAGPLPYTFDYEPETHSIIAIKATRAEWHPMPIRVEVVRNTFIETDPFKDARLRLVSAFHTAGIAYHWERGVRYLLPRTR